MLLRLPYPDVRFTWSTDWHFSTVPPGRRADDYCQALFDKLEFIRETTEQLHAVHLCGADVFHHKKPTHPGNSFNLIVRLLHMMHRFPTSMIYGSVGNHDLSWDRMDSLPHQPLGLLIAAGVYHDLTADPIIFTNEDDTVRVLVESWPYDDEEATFQRILKSSKVRPAGIDYRIGIVHAFGQPGNRGNLYDSAIIGYNELKDVDYDFLLWGHDHSYKKTVTVGNVTHVNFGALARAAYNFDEVNRKVLLGVMAFSKEGIKYKEKEIPVKPLELVFSTADKGMDKVVKSDAVKNFFSDMDEAVSGIESIDPRTVLRSLCPEDTKLVAFTEELCGL
jgi:DNA repair exonuclease SbcCD nuclease subunit